MLYVRYAVVSLINDVCGLILRLRGIMKSRNGKLNDLNAAVLLDVLGDVGDVSLSDGDKEM